MPGEIFYWVFNMSIAATICGIPVVLLRFIKRIPRRIFLWLWLIPFARMCFPIGISGKYGLMALLSRVTTKTVTVYQTDHGSAFTMMNCVMGANSYFPITYKVRPLERVFSVAAVIWMIGALALLLAFCMIYLTTVKALKVAQPLRDNLYLSDQIRTPAVYGIIKPVILLPYRYNEEELGYILMHEQAHIRRKDNLVRAAALIVVCIHWFNPAAWLCLKWFFSDMELACDETVLAGCNDKQKKAYAHTLLSSVEKTDLFAASFGGAKIRVRLENILSYRKLSVFSVIGFSALIITIAYMLLTNAY